jgi:integrase/recombinase XerD
MSSDFILSANKTPSNMKQNRRGQATLFTESEYRKLRDVVTNRKHRLYYDVAWWTGERMGAILKLRVENIYRDVRQSEPHDYVTYPASIRKDKKTRQVVIHPNLKTELWAFRPPLEGYLFQRDRHPGQAITMSDFDAMMRYHLHKLGWHERGFSSHSFRRSFITRLHENGTDPVLMMQLTGHASLANLMRYVETDPKRVDRALLSL